MTQSKSPVIIRTHDQTASISFVPFLKKAPVHQPVIPQPSIKKEAIKNPVEEKKKVPAPIVKKVTAKKQTALVPVKKNVVQPKKKLPVVKPVVKKSVEKKVLPKAQEPVKVPAVKKIEKVDPPIKKMTKVPLVESVQTNTFSPTVPETIILGCEERELFVMQDTLKKDIVKNWKRPTNIPETAVCQFRVLVYKNGNREVIMEKSSQAMALDISARNFLTSYDFPEHWCGKELSIIF